MKLTKTKLKQLIQEELNKVLKEEYAPYRDEASLLRDLANLRDFVTKQEDDPNYSDWTEPGGDLASVLPKVPPDVAKGILGIRSKIPTKEDDLRTIEQKLNDAYRYVLNNINAWKRKTPDAAGKILFDTLKEDLEGIVKRIKATNEDF